MANINQQILKRRGLLLSIAPCLQYISGASLKDRKLTGIIKGLANMCTPLLQIILTIIKFGFSHNVCLISFCPHVWLPAWHNTFSCCLCVNMRMNPLFRRLTQRSWFDWSRSTCLHIRTGRRSCRSWSASCMCTMSVWRTLPRPKCYRGSAVEWTSSASAPTPTTRRRPSLASQSK